MIIAISALNNLTAKVTVYISLWVNFYKLPYTQIQALNLIKYPLVLVLYVNAYKTDTGLVWMVLSTI